MKIKYELYLNTHYKLIKYKLADSTIITFLGALPLHYVTRIE